MQFTNWEIFFASKRSVKRVNCLFITAPNVLFSTDTAINHRVMGVFINITADIMISGSLHGYSRLMKKKNSDTSGLVAIY